jgi:endogenous inhibitor of DNA gyrase (YacG/DUF329 family)
MGEPHFPFCSERCRLIDLGNWAAEKYVISTPVQAETESEDENNGRPDRESRSENE